MKKQIHPYEMTMAVRVDLDTATIVRVNYNLYRQMKYSLNSVPNYSSVIFYELTKIIMEEANRK